VVEKHSLSSITSFLSTFIGRIDCSNYDCKNNPRIRNIIAVDVLLNIVALFQFQLMMMMVFRLDDGDLKNKISLGSPLIYNKY
jgi:hypothetical protein